MASSLRRPRYSRVSLWLEKCCVIVFNPLFRSGVSADLGVEDEKVGIQFSDMSPHIVPMLFKHFPTLRFGTGTLPA